MDSNFPEKNNSQILIYQTEGGKTKIEVRLESELSHEATVKEYLTVQKEGNRQVSRIVDFYNLERLVMHGVRNKQNG